MIRISGGPLRLLRRLSTMGKRSVLRLLSHCGVTAGGYTRRPESRFAKQLRERSILPKVGKGSKREVSVEKVLWPVGKIDEVVFRWLIRRDLSMADWRMHGRIYQLGVYEGYDVCYRDELVARITPVMRWTEQGHRVVMEVRANA